MQRGDESTEEGDLAQDVDGEGARANQTADRHRDAQRRLRRADEETRPVVCRVP